MRLTKINYHTLEANLAYWSTSQFKSFDKCEAMGLAEVNGDYYRDDTDALLIGGYVDAYFANEMEYFRALHGDQLYSKRGGGLLAKYQHANDLIARVKADPLMMDFLTGDKQVVMTAEICGVPWKGKLDVYNGKRIVDLKTVKDFGDVWVDGYGYKSWIEAWGYDIQGAIYQKLEQGATGRPYPLPFYIAAVTKEKYPDIKVIEIPQHILDAALVMVDAKIERYDMIKHGEVEPIRCERCDYCKTTKVLTSPEIYEIREAE